jgi:mannan endo-1,4-beta-mannosidase
VRRTAARALVVAAVPFLAALAGRGALGPVQGAGFVGRAGTRFVLDGEPFHYTGTNNYYLMVFSVARSGLRPYVDEVLQEAAARGIRVVRTWAFNDGLGWNALQTAPGAYDEEVFQGLDFVLERSRQLGLRVILTLVNNWADYGGMDQYVAWSPTADLHDQFYTDVNTRAYYRNHMAAVILRVNSLNGRLYRDDPTVFAWELANEPRCMTFDPPLCASDRQGGTLLDWITEMSAWARSLDPNHLVTTGSEGFYDDGSGPWYLDGSQGVDFRRDHEPATIDFATAHSWPDDWALGFDPVMQLLDRQIDDGQHTLGKPFVLAEFGKVRQGAPPRPRNHYDPRTLFPPGRPSRPVPGAAPVWIDPGNSATAYGAPPGASPGGGGTATRDLFFSAYYRRMSRSCGAGSHFWLSCHDAYPDYGSYCVYDPADVSTMAIISGNALLTTGMLFCDGFEGGP